MMRLLVQKQILVRQGGGSSGEVVPRSSSSSRCFASLEKQKRFRDIVARALADALQVEIADREGEERLQMIGLRRDVHNGRYKRVEEQRALVAGVVELEALTRSLLRLAAVCEQGEARFEAEFKKQLEDQWTQLIELTSRTPAFIFGLGFSSPSLLSRYALRCAAGVHDKAWRRFARAVTAHWLRYRLKVSPFSTFGGYGWAGLDGAASGPSPAWLEYEIKAGLFQKAFAHRCASGDLGGLQVTLNPSVEVTPGWIRYITLRHGEERHVKLRNRADIRELLGLLEPARAPVSGIQLQQACSAAGFDERKISELLEIGLLVEHEFYSGCFAHRRAFALEAEMVGCGLADPLGAARWAANIEANTARRLKDMWPDTLRSVSPASSEVPRATSTNLYYTGLGRPVGVDDDNQAVASVAAWIQGNASGEALRRQQRRLAEFHRRVLGGAPIPLLQFYSRLIRCPSAHRSVIEKDPGAPAIAVERFRRFASLSATDTVRLEDELFAEQASEFVPPHLSSGAANWQYCDVGGCRQVINSVTPGLFKMQSRFLEALTGEERKALVSEIRGAYPGLRLVQVRDSLLYNADRAVPVCDEVLDLPWRCGEAGGVALVRLEDLVIGADAATGTPGLWHRGDGARVGLVASGLVQERARTPFYNFLACFIINREWSMSAFNNAIGGFFSNPSAAAASGLVSLPRIVAGAVMLRRRAVMLTASYVAELLSARSAASRFGRIHRALSLLEAEACYYRLVTREAGGHAKPLYLSLDCLPTIELLLHHCGSTPDISGVVLEEAAPRPLAGRVAEEYSVNWIVTA